MRFWAPLSEGFPEFLFNVHYSILLVIAILSTQEMGVGRGLVMALLGTLCFSAGNMLSSLQQKAGLKPLTSNAWGMLYGAVMLAAICLVSGTPFAFEWSTRYVGSLLYLAIPGSVIGFTAYLTLVGRLGPERAAYCTVLFPVVALNISVFAEGYQWSAPALLGLVLVMLGNVLVFSKPKPLLPLAQALGGKAG